MRVAAGAIAKKYLAEKFGIVIRGHVTQIGSKEMKKLDWNEVPNNPFLW
jgi:chorismate synthase